MQHSRFYQRFYRGLGYAPLAELPVLEKRELMGSFNELVTDPDVHLTDVLRHLGELRGNERYLDRYWVSRTAGATGHPGIFLTDRDEWSTIIASYARAQEWAGIDAKLTRRTRLAVVSSRVPWHQSARVAASIDAPFVPVRRVVDEQDRPVPPGAVGLALATFRRIESSQQCLRSRLAGLAGRDARVLARVHGGATRAHSLADAVVDRRQREAAMPPNSA